MHLKLQFQSVCKYPSSFIQFIILVLLVSFLGCSGGTDADEQNTITNRDSIESEENIKPGENPRIALRDHRTSAGSGEHAKLKLEAECVFCEVTYIITGGDEEIRDTILVRDTWFVEFPASRGDIVSLTASSLDEKRTLEISFGKEGFKFDIESDSLSVAIYYNNMLINSDAGPGYAGVVMQGIE
jgi:hypothetical protein